uniref:Zinc transporter foi n=1 Tax=Macrostomum lignano TaxID=282301 RepID=A0A1I8G7C8_9PLAT
QSTVEYARISLFSFVCLEIERDMRCRPRLFTAVGVLLVAALLHQLPLTEQHSLQSSTAEHGNGSHSHRLNPLISEATEGSLPSEFMHRLFSRYGTRHYLPFVELKHLLTHIGIEETGRDSEIDARLRHSDGHEDHKNVGIGVDGVKTVQKRHAETEGLPSVNECITPLEYFYLVGREPDQALSVEEFIGICPALIQQLDSHLCDSQLRSIHESLQHATALSHASTAVDSIGANPAGGADSANSSGNGTDLHDDEAGFAKPKVWLVSFVSILIISLVGLAGVAVVPLVRSTYYNHFIQYLVALAVGSLTGDAMLHLLPHAIVKSAMEDAHAERCHDEKQTVFKGLVALGGVYFFFMAEKIVALVGEYRSEQHAAEEAASAKREAEFAAGGGHNSGSAGSAALGPDGSEQQERHHAQHSAAEAKRMAQIRRGVGKSCDEILAVGLSSKALRNIDAYKTTADNNCHSDTEDNSEEQCHPLTCPDNQDTTVESVPMSNLLQVPGSFSMPATTEGIQDDAGVTASDLVEEANPDATLVVPQSAPGSSVPSLSRKRRSHGHSHGHGHGHAHGHGQMPQSLVSVAWMVIFGDGLHNFTDGLAIGAAFAQSITGGISTSIAVFCHELPHELGDFAVLLKTGMRVKQALFYNVLSSILAAVGMVIGIFLGNVTSASYWIFAITGGIFIYISLVDMLPELNLVNVKHGESRIAHFVLQNAGILTGVGIMFVIAMFEDNIKNMLGDSGHAKIEFVGPC